MALLDLARADAWAASLGDSPGMLPASAVRELDGEEYLEGEPIWLCPDSANEPAGIPGWFSHRFVLVGADESGQVQRHGPDLRVPLAMPGPDASGHVPMRRGAEFAHTFALDDPSGRMPLITPRPTMPAGAWEIRRGGSGPDSARVLARFRVVEPRRSERSVRDGLARAARLAHRGPDGPPQAARLYDAILRRYPRTTYLSVIYAGMWEVRAHTRFAADPDRWLEEVFARFHDTCFGTIALDQWVRDMGEARARPTVARLVGLYPDTPLARAARRYL